MLFQVVYVNAVFKSFTVHIAPNLNPITQALALTAISYYLIHFLRQHFILDQKLSLLFKKEFFYDSSKGGLCEKSISFLIGMALFFTSAG